MVAGPSTSLCKRDWRSPVILALLVAIGCDRPPEKVGEPRPVGAEPVEDLDRPPQPERPVELQVGEAIERAISPGETHEYRLGLEAGDYINFEATQRGIDVELSLLDPEGELVLVMDLPIADLGTEPIVHVAENSGLYTLLVRAWDSEDPSGSYLATLAARRPASNVDEQRSRAALLVYRGETSAWAGRYLEAIASYLQAGAVWRRVGDDYWLAVTLDREADSRSRLGELAQASELYESVARILANLDEPHLAAINANELAQVYLQRGDLDRSIEKLQRALSLRRQSGDRRGEGMTLGMLARIYGVRGNVQQALDHYEQALELLHLREDRRYRATTLHDLGTLYHRLGKPSEAVLRLRSAERIYAELGEVRFQAYSLSQVGQLVFEAGDMERALRILNESLVLSRRRGDRLAQIGTLRRIGSVLLARGDVDAAQRSYASALELVTGLDSPRSEAAVLIDLGSLCLRLGKGEQALEYQRRASAILSQVGDPVRLAEALLGEAEALRQIGRLKAALEPASEALEITESLRVSPFSEDLRLSYFSTAQPVFDLNIELLMELHAIEPYAGHAASALQVNERARARSLLDLLTEAGAEIRADAAPELLRQEREMQFRLNANVELLERHDITDRQRREATHEVRRAVSRLHSIRGSIRRHSPRYASLTQPRPLSLSEIQDLLDSNSALLEYRLGKSRSYLWLITQDSLVTFELPPRWQIERNARQSHKLMAQVRRESEGRTRALLCELSRQLLQPASGRLGTKRLAIVADGALEYLPFAALPDPESSAGCSAAEPLVSNHEIVHLPSASALALMRHEARGRVAPDGTIAVVADPVFDRNDPRLGKRDTSSPDPHAALALRSPEDAGLPTFRRLPFSREEAMAILKLVPEERSFRALGFDASKEVVLSGRLGGFRVVHFATHGDLNTEEPALSRIVFSLVGRDGQPVEGSLRAHEIYNLSLPADLVVLSGCRTALGREVRGEGLVGLTRGFMYAGASRVMVSLWEVSDRSTAELMQSFYRSLLKQRHTPAAALRLAQLEMRERRPQPFFWAGFVLQGDWR